MAEWILETERLRLRRIEPGDAQLQFGLLNTPAIMHHLGGPLSLEAIEQKHRKSMDLHEREGFSFLFLIERDTGEFVGHCGLKRVDAEGAHNPGDVEIGWSARIAGGAAMPSKLSARCCAGPSSTTMHRMSSR